MASLLTFSKLEMLELRDLENEPSPLSAKFKWVAPHHNNYNGLNTSSLSQVF